MTLSFAPLQGASMLDWSAAAVATLIGLGVVLFAFLVVVWLTLRFIPNDYVGVVEKLWSQRGSVPEGHILALKGEAGFQADLLRGGLHYGFWRWQYRVHLARLVTVPQGKIGYVYARDGQPLAPSQTLGHAIQCNNFQDAHAFLGDSVKDGALGQRGRQAAILREGVYAINPAIFIVMTDDACYTLPHALTLQELKIVESWQKELLEIDGFRPVVVGRSMNVEDPMLPGTRHLVDTIGIVTIHDGPSLPPGEIIAPMVGNEAGDGHYHNNFQDPDSFLLGGGRRGRQYQVLTDGTYFINRWFATIELAPKTVVPIGYVGVVVSYYGKAGRDISGTGFRHGERVADGERGVWQRPFGPGKYAFNAYAGSIVLVPTTNFVLHWVTGKSETHRYDESLRSIELVTRDAYEPSLPLSVVVHIDYERAPNVIQRFGDVKKLITQTLDPLLSAYFRDIAHKKTMLELLHDRDLIQNEAREELRRRFRDFDIECVDVLIGKPDTETADGKIEGLLEQLRTRQLSVEQIETYERQRAAAEKRRLLSEAESQADMQTQLTSARVKAQIAESHGEAELALARKQAEKSIVMADAELAQSRRRAEQTIVLAESDARKLALAGQGDGKRIMQIGLAEAAVLGRKLESYGDPRIYAMQQVASSLAKSSQPLVPERVFLTNGGEAGGTSAVQTGGMVGLLLQLLLAERTTLEGANALSNGQRINRIEQDAHAAMAETNGANSSAN